MTVPPNAKYQERFLKVYREARENRRGVVEVVHSGAFFLKHSHCDLHHDILHLRW
jgi:hypothetical protein